MSITRATWPRRMVSALQGLGGLYEYDDFAEYESPLEEPISVTYRGYQIFTNRSWTQGISLLQTLAILDGFDLAALGHNSPPGPFTCKWRP